MEKTGNSKADASRPDAARRDPSAGVGASANGGKLERLANDGFELLRDLEKGHPKSFAGLYLSWYAEASGAISTLAPARLAEFQRLFRQDKRRKLDLETYGIEDYLMGVCLHGGFADYDVMRAITARRFHLQLLLLKALLPDLRRGLDELDLQAARNSVSTILSEAENALGDGHHDLAIALMHTATRLHLRNAAQRITKRTPTAKTEAVIIAERLEAKGHLKAEDTKAVSRIETLAASPNPITEDEIREGLALAGKLFATLN